MDTLISFFFEHGPIVVALFFAYVIFNHRLLHSKITESKKWESNSDLFRTATKADLNQANEYVKEIGRTSEFNRLVLRVINELGRDNFKLGHIYWAYEVIDGSNDGETIPKFEVKQQ